ncbi:hypothetical protein TH47_04355 [Thalassospira sp. MCCC 1A02803]|nr:hypothetical protein TH47_04355 [Thalassospira sp. MCCC 1A02803]
MRAAVLGSAHSKSIFAFLARKFEPDPDRISPINT